MASEIFERVSFEADELTARVATYSCYLAMRLVTPLLEYEDGSVKKGNFAHDAGIIKLWKVKRKG